MQPNAETIPDGYRLTPAGDLRTLSAGRILIGGAPLTIMRLSPAGAKTVAGWFSGEAIGRSAAQVTLARRIQRNGMGRLHRAPDIDAGSDPHTDPKTEPKADNLDRPDLSQLTVIIPVKDDRSGVADTLDHLLGPDCAGPDSSDADAAADLTTGPHIIVVDDGSHTPLSIERASVTVVRNEAAAGPGQARQRGFEMATTGTVAFVDAGVLISADQLAKLADTLVDEAAVAAAPRVVSAPRDDAIGRYEQRRSPLDLGPTASLVGPGRAVPYVPTACLVVRAAAVRNVGGFDPDLRYGEDVDLIWRLLDEGDVHYLADVEATHQARATLKAMADQRRSYGSAAAPLAIRHGDAVSPAKLSAWSLLVATLAAVGRPVAALTLRPAQGLP